VTDGAIDRYLDELFVELRRSAPRDARSLLSETESHLRDTADASVLAGMAREDAEVDAVTRFGAASQLAARDRRRSRPELVRGIAVSGWALGSIGAVAVGISGIVAGVMRLAGASNAFIAGNQSTSHLGAADCARWLAGYPHAATCAQAALDDWAWETVGYRIALGVLGLAALGVLLVARRRWSAARAWMPLPNTVVDTVSTTVFLGAGVWLAGLGVDALVVRSGHGAGMWLSAAPVALAVGAVSGLRLVRDLTQPA
jgi:hypothetical protein